MKEFHKLELTLDEVNIVADINKRIMECFAEKIHKIKEKQKEFDAVTFTLSVTILNLLSNYNINDPKKIKLFMDDLYRLMMTIQKPVKENSFFMEYKNGKKVSEGKFN